uniref:Uncharacterized protein n=1 Tax=Marseillevirus LCMAC101 TaxID=2506602 RepID=A0A481YU64_9VIRU|nr:MAG: hypothetical protein LCMAC101_06410 [Marseillevirus LCMAC101]
MMIKFAVIVIWIFILKQESHCESVENDGDPFKILFAFTEEHEAARYLEYAHQKMVKSDFSPKMIDELKNHPNPVVQKYAQYMDAFNRGRGFA